MVPQRSTTWALRVLALFIALTAGVVPARAQRVPAAWNLPPDPGYVSLSGAVTFGFSPYREEQPVWSADPVGAVPPEPGIPGVCRQLLDEMWRGSATFRRQWTRLSSARVRVTVAIDKPASGAPPARARISRVGGLRVEISLQLVDRRAVEYLAHEIEHVLEALDDVDLPQAVAQRVHGATAVGKPPAFETRRAIAVGRVVAEEVTAYQARR
jgi:hypothetical protein